MHQKGPCQYILGKSIPLHRFLQLLHSSYCQLPRIYALFTERHPFQSYYTSQFMISTCNVGPLLFDSPPYHQERQTTWEYLEIVTLKSLLSIFYLSFVKRYFCVGQCEVFLAGILHQVFVIFITACLLKKPSYRLLFHISLQFRCWLFVKKYL